MTESLVVDIYSGDRPCDWAVFAAAGAPWSGAIFKASQGIRYRYDRWLTTQVYAFRTASGARYGVDLFDGFYHYLDLAADGAAQADYFVGVIEACGGEKLGSLWGMVDVESGGQAPANQTRSRVEDTTRAFAARYQQLTGRLPTLYGGALLREVGVKDRLGCGRSAVALYAAELHARGETTAAFLRRTGTDLEHLLLWQYTAADGSPAPVPSGYPREAPGCGRVDISALVLPGGLAALRAGLWAERPIP